MTKIAINTTSANFMLSRAAYNWLIQNCGWRYIGNYDVYKEGTTINTVVNANDDAIPVTITATAGSNGTITRRNSTTPLIIGSTAIYDIAATTGYYASNVVVDGFDGGAGLTTLTFGSLTDNHIVNVTFTANATLAEGEHTVDIYGSVGGTISARGRQVVASAGTITVTATPFSGFTYDSIKIDGTPVDITSLGTGTYTHEFSSLTANARIEILFKPVSVLEITPTRVTKLLWTDTSGTWYMNVTDRSDADLINCIETLTLTNAAGTKNTLKIVEIPDNVASWVVERACTGGEQIVTPYQKWS